MDSHDLDLDIQLRKAAFKGNIDECKALIERGASVHGDVTDNEFSPLQSAAVGGHSAVCALLIKHGADVGAKGHGELTALQLAVYGGMIATTEYLIRHCGEDVNQVTHDGVTLEQLAREVVRADTADAMVECLVTLRSEMTAREVGSALGDAEIGSMPGAFGSAGPLSL
jgi:hypothetical protein